MNGDFLLEMRQNGVIVEGRVWLIRSIPDIPERIHHTHGIDSLIFGKGCTAALLTKEPGKIAQKQDNEDNSANCPRFRSNVE